MDVMKIALDKSTIGGIALALAGIGIGLVLDGGKLAQVLQPTAALIVIGGTLGAVMVQFPLRIVLQALAQLKHVFLDSEPESDALVQNLLRYAYKARKEGLLSLDAELAKIQDPFLKESLISKYFCCYKASNISSNVLLVFLNFCNELLKLTNNLILIFAYTSTVGAHLHFPPNFQDICKSFRLKYIFIRFSDQNTIRR